MKTVSLCLAVVLGALPLFAEQTERSRLSVFVTSAPIESRKHVPDSVKDDLKAKMNAAKKERETLEKQLKKQYGKKRESWPPPQDDELFALEETELAVIPKLHFVASLPSIRRSVQLRMQRKEKLLSANLSKTVVRTLCLRLRISSSPTAAVHRHEVVF